MTPIFFVIPKLRRERGIPHDREQFASHPFIVTDEITGHHGAIIRTAMLCGVTPCSKCFSDLSESEWFISKLQVDSLMHSGQAERQPG